MVVVLAFAVFLAGCGGGSGSATATEADSIAATSQGEITKAEYIEEADEACARQRRKLRGLISPYLQGRGLSKLSPSLAARMMRKTLGPAMSYEIRRVRIIVLPKRDVEQVLEFLATWQEIVDEGERRPADFVRAGNPLAKSERLAREYGFKICGAF